MSNAKTRILYLEDDLNDRELIPRALAEDGVECEFVFARTEAEFEAALASSSFDLILSDFTLPCFNGIEALALARAAQPEAPFLFVSGTIGEERAVEGLRSGATDFVLKHHLNRLPEAVRRALREADQIREQRRVIEALRESEERFRQVTESINEVFWLTDVSKNQMIYVSRAYEKIWGQTCASLYAAPQSWIEAIHPEDSDRVRNAAATLQVSGDYDLEYRIVRPDGSIRLIHDHASPVKNPQGQTCRVAGVAEDITERRQLEDQLRQAQKMEAIGQLAGGIAHDFNNLLAVIQIQTSLLATEPDLGPTLKNGIQLVMAAVEQAANLTRQLLTFSRQKVKVTEDLDVRDVFDTIFKMLRRILGEDITLETRFAPSLPLINADRGMVEQILMNLVINARDAMSHGGQLSVIVEPIQISEVRVAGKTGVVAGPFICLTIADSGCGIAPENLSHIFEPFFTTKEVGKGTGLGLATVFGIVEQHHGWIEVESKVDEGTIFRVFLPALQCLAQKPAAEVKQEEIRGGNEVILLVEDDPPLRGLAQVVLERYGYRVLEASTAAAALEIWRAQRLEIDLLLTDLIMPGGTSGQELASQLQADKPGLKVIYSSGYSDNVVSRHMRLAPGRNFLQKPYSTSNLAATVRRCLDESSDTARPPSRTP